MKNFKFITVVSLLSTMFLFGCKSQEEIYNEINANYLKQIESNVCGKTITAVSSISNKDLDEPLYLFNLCNPLQHKIGFMNQKDISSNIGLLFVFQKEDELAFWMKNTHIPLDLAYLNKDNIVISTHTMKPLDLTSIPSPSPAMYVIEMKQGAFEKYEIKIGSQFNF